jgi:hypothetical protein
MAYVGVVRRKFILKLFRALGNVMDKADIFLICNSSQIEQNVPAEPCAHANNQLRHQSL